MSDFGTRLKELRTRRHLRQADLARALGVAQTTIANYESKARFPDERMLLRLADHFETSLDFLLGRTGVEETDPVSAGTPVDLSPVARRYLELLRGNRRDAAEELIAAAIREGASIGEVYVGILEPALKETGRLWESGALAVGEEHAITLATQHIMSRHLPRVGARQDGPLPPVCLALAAGGEQHLIGPVMVCDLLRLDGWEVVFPGGNLAIRHVLELAEIFKPRLLAVSVTIPAYLSAAADLVSSVRRNGGARGARILVGGQAMRERPSLWQEVGADATAADAISAVATANRLIGRTPKEGA